MRHFSRQLNNFFTCSGGVSFFSSLPQAAKSPLLGLPLVGVCINTAHSALFCSALLSFFFFVDTQLQHSSRPKRTSFSSSFYSPHTHTQTAAMGFTDLLTDAGLTRKPKNLFLARCWWPLVLTMDASNSPEQLGFHPLLRYWVCPLPLAQRRRRSPPVPESEFRPFYRIHLIFFCHRLSHNQAMICMQRPSPSFIFFHPSVPA